MAPLIVGLAGIRLREDERAFLAETRPLGIILFARNIGSAEEIERLVADAKAASGASLVFIDQEGGRVQRIRPPLVPRYPPAAAIGRVFEADEAAGRRAAYLVGYLIASDLARFGINAPCLPVADVPVPGSHDVIGDRAYATTPGAVAILAGAAAAGVKAAGGFPVLKHIPGHGRAAVDSHVSLPVVDASREALEADFTPFRELSALPMAMTAHVRYTALDPARCATLSPTVINLIRNEIGFDGLLMSDDISMGALGSDLADNAAAALAAGCDCVLHCNGDLAEMRLLADHLAPMAPLAARRLAQVLNGRSAPEAGDIEAMREEFAALTGAAV
ncbi:beta-N-acetylhexosaminidase [Acuticoccus sp. M5D2P5]|uniref:beta-N-acetylhexosaminidase n=1 Tax=Acuticoccus kalidii TaxID=2910977 RepID=UPI001F23221F|nr:beta-N-acetylhexosaminidase [Acuticoccus kalidii]MCF3933046.1 beta-N-acetylhexosaminidase [Acuticoccus kalidii]